MRMTPVKTRPMSRHLWVKFLVWEIVLRMKVLHGDPDVWFLESIAPTGGSPCEQTRAYGSGLANVGSVSVIHLAESEAQFRVDAIHDYFRVLRAAMWSRSVYSIYVMCRSTIEACAFAAWVFDPEVKPAERLLRGLLLRERSLHKLLKSLREEMEGHRLDELDPGYLADVATARSKAETQLDEIRRAIGGIRADLESMEGPPPKRPLTAPSATRLIRKMFLDDMGMPQGSDAYHRLSGVAHSEAIAIIATWSLDGGKPSIDYYSFLKYLHLALCSIDFSLGRRAACWGQTHKSAGLHKIIGRVEHIIEGEPDVHLM